MKKKSARLIAIIIFLVGLGFFIPNVNLTGLQAVTSETSYLSSPTFQQFLTLTVSPSFIDEEGIGNNNNPWVSVRFQMVASDFIMRGISTNDASYIEKGMRAIEYSFTKQNPDGSFQYNNTVGASPEDIIEGEAFFMSAVGHSIHLLSSSPYSATYNARIQALQPQIAQSLTYLKSQEGVLSAKGANAPNRLLFDAIAFTLNGDQATGGAFLNQALATQSPEGYFTEYGGYDSSYQGVSLVNIQLYNLYVPSGLETVIASGIVWEKTRILSTGEVDTTGNTRSGSNCTVDTPCKSVDYPAVAEALLHHYGISNDADSLLTAQKLIAFVTGVPLPTPESQPVSTGGGGSGGGYSGFVYYQLEGQTCVQKTGNTFPPTAFNTLESCKTQIVLTTNNIVSTNTFVPLLLMLIATFIYVKNKEGKR